MNSVKMNVHVILMMIFYTYEHELIHKIETQKIYIGLHHFIILSFDALS